MQNKHIHINLDDSNQYWNYAKLGPDLFLGIYNLLKNKDLSPEQKKELYSILNLNENLEISNNQRKRRQKSIKKILLMSTKTNIDLPDLSNELEIIKYASEHEVDDLLEWYKSKWINQKQKSAIKTILSLKWKHDRVINQYEEINLEETNLEHILYRFWEKGSSIKREMIGLWVKNNELGERFLNALRHQIENLLDNDLSFWDEDSFLEKEDFDRLDIDIKDREHLEFLLDEIENFLSNIRRVKTEKKMERIYRNYEKNTIKIIVPEKEKNLGKKVKRKKKKKKSKRNNKKK